jgi:hypothetical protein
MERKKCGEPNVSILCGETSEEHMKRTALASLTALTASLVAAPGLAEAAPPPACQLGAIPITEPLNFRITNGEQVRAGLSAGEVMGSLFGLSVNSRLGSNYVLKLTVFRGDDNDSFGQFVSNVEITDGQQVELAPIYNFGSTVENYFVTGTIFQEDPDSSDPVCSSELQIPNFEGPALANVAVVPNCASTSRLGFRLPGPFTVGSPYSHTFTEGTVGTQAREADIIEVGSTSLEFPASVGIGSQVSFTPPSTSFDVRARTFEGFFWEQRTCTGPTEIITVTAASPARVASQKPVKKASSKKPRASKPNK